jgi:zinc D-Ala-D-Ala carboxypeptidase
MKTPTADGAQPRWRGGTGRLLRGALAIVVALLTSAVVTVTTAGPAAADGCYTWGATLREGSRGEAVRQLQIRVAGWVATDEVLAVDGEYGGRTKAAVARFQTAYGLTSDGIAGPQTFAKFYALQDDDCTPIHFTYPEFDKCDSNYTGSSKVNQATAKARTLQVMWQMEAVRRKLGDRPLRITSGFRNDACNRQAGGATNSPHLYGVAGDLGAGSQTLCQIYRVARTSGFSGLLGPGYDGHDDHVHADNRHVIGRSAFRSAPSC